MTADRWRQVEDVFHAALARSPASRRAYLARACGSDAELRREVESLLEATDAADYLDAPPPIDALVPADGGDAAEDAAAIDAARDAESEVGRRIGPYRLTARLGAGGMGAVYLGEREDDVYHAEVAVKIVKRGMDTAEILRRFRTERQALANLSHPFIARLFDGGSLDDGRPYLVMERVEGRRIDHHCDQSGLGVAARLRLFRKVCAAVHHAHQRLVVHRDLKPSNILITDAGDPKLLDFGVAKLLDPPAGAALTEERPGAGRWMTLGYASPEQVRGESITTASDVYSLGVVLRELLTGRRSSPARSIVSSPAPSSPPDPTPPASAPSPSRPPRDLVNVVAMATHEEPARRYASAEHLAHDLQRYLDGLPVLARKDTLAYRASKFVRRNRLLVGAALVVAVSLVAGVVGTLSQAIRAGRERDSAAQAQAEAEEVTRFLVGLFDAADDAWGHGEAVPAIDLLDRGARRVAGELRDRPAVRAALMHAIGAIYCNLGAYDRAEPLVVEALGLYETPGVGDSRRVAAVLMQLGDLRRLQGDPKGALPLLERARALRETATDPEPLELASCLNSLAVVHRLLGDLPRAEALLRDAMDDLRRATTTDSALHVGILANLAAVEVSRAHFAEAARYAEDALEVQERALGPEHPSRAAPLTILGMARLRGGDAEGATRAFREVVASRTRAWGDRHPSTAVAKSSLGLALRAMGESAEAERLFRAAVDVLREVPAVAQPQLSAAEANLAELLYTRGDRAGAEALYRAALDRFGRSLGEDHPEYAGALNNVAFLREAAGDLEEAAALYQRALDIDRRRLPAGHPDRTLGLENLARVRRAAGRPEDAETLLREALANASVSSGTPPRALDRIRLSLAGATAERGEIDLAEDLLDALEADVLARAEQDGAVPGEDADVLDAVRAARAQAEDLRRAADDRGDEGAVGGPGG